MLYADGVTRTGMGAFLFPGWRHNPDSDMATVAQGRVTEDGRFRVDALLRDGVGRCGIVHGGIEVATGRPVALKVFRSNDMADAEAEARDVCGDNDVPYLIARPERTLVKSVSGALCSALVYPLHPGDVHHALELSRTGYLADDVVRNIIRCVAAALEVLHGRGLVHQDIKPANVLQPANPGSPYVLADLGLCCALNAAPVLFRRGTPGWMAPEKLAFARGMAGLDKSVLPTADMWALGAMAASLLTGRDFPDKALECKRWSELTDGARDFIMACTTEPPAKRLTAHQALQHPWLL